MMRIRRKLIVLMVIVVLILLMSQAALGQTITASNQNFGFSQLSGTTGGELRRYIDISSPWSGGYHFEDMTVIGSASVTESFTMNNFGPGSEADYWNKAVEDFDSGFNTNPDIFPKAASPVSPAPVSGSVSKPAAAVAGVSAIAKPEDKAGSRAGFRWRDLF